VDCNLSGDTTNSIISLSGTMDFSDHEKIRTVIGQLRDQGAKSVIADLSSLTNIDSAGIGMLLLLDEVGKDAGFSFSVRGVNGQVEQVLNVCNLSEVVNFI
jgi:HptB-dependent secretion and biofilm anti anti-sigma factor